MLLFGNRKIFSTYNQRDYVNVGNILSANGIDYTTKVKDLSSPNLFESNRAIKGTLGTNQEYMKEYVIMVRKEDYPRAKQILGI